MATEITGTTATEIAASVRGLLDLGRLGPGDPLPSVRGLAADLGLNRNTVIAAYRQLSAAGILETRGRAGTRVADVRPLAQEGYAPDTVLRDVGTGNPDPERIPDPTPVLARMPRRPVLYGEPVVDAGLGAWAREWFAADLAGTGRGRGFRISVTNGAVDATERLLSQWLARDDAVALEDPCFLASMRTIRLGGYRPVAVPVDDEGMTPDGLRAALEAGVRAVIVTPRAQNPTGASLTERRAADLREVLAGHPHVLVIEDDHFALLSREPYRGVVGPEHERWALVRSVSKPLGPDTCLALVASDRRTAERLALRLSPGTTWVSHLLQRLAHGLLSDPEVRDELRSAAEHYAERNAAFAAALTAAGLPAEAGDGLSLWVDVRAPAGEVVTRLMRRGWLARPGTDFSLTGAASTRLRLTVHGLDDDEQRALAADVAAAAGPDSA